MKNVICTYLLIALSYCCTTSALTAQVDSSLTVHELLDRVLNKENTTSYKDYQALKKFAPSDFDISARSKINELLVTYGPYYRERLELAGYLQMKSELEALKSGLSESVYMKKISKNKALLDTYRLALVRSGDNKLLDNMVRNMKKVKLGDDYVYSVVPQVVYTRQKKAFDLLLDQILVKVDYCSPADADTKGQISCAYRIIEEIAPYIESFPIRSTKLGLETDDYPAALAQTRAWIRKNKNKYKLKTDIF